MRRFLTLFKLLLMISAILLIILSLPLISAIAENEPLTITIDISNKEYDGVEIGYSVKFKDSSDEEVTVNPSFVTQDFYNIDDLLTPLSSAPTDAGSYRIVVTYDENSETPQYLATSEYIDFQIAKRNINLIISSANNIYGSLTPVWTCSQPLLGTSYAQGQDETDLDIDYSWAEAFKNVGTHTSKSSVIGNNNYNAIFSWSYVIQPRNITVSVQPVHITYGDAFTLAAELTSGTFGYDDDIDDLALSYKANGEDFNELDLSVYGSGVHTITASDNNANYNTTVISSKLTINKYIAQIEVSGRAVYGVNVSKNRIVDPEENIFSHTLKNELAYGDVYEDLEAVYYVEMHNPAVGSNYTILSTHTNANYSILLNSATLTVTPREFRATIDDKTAVYGDEIKFTLTVEEGYSYAPEDNINSLNVYFTGYNKAVSGAPYTVTATALSPNYAAVFTSGNLTITPRDITIVVHDLVITYGESKKFQYELQAGHILPYMDQLYMLDVIIDADEKKVGNYQAICSYNNDNYNVTFKGGNYIINKKRIDIQIDEVSIVYGETPIFSCSVKNDGLVFSDTLEDLNIAYIPESKYAGERYEISASYSNPNYYVNFISGRLYIAKKPITVVIEDVTVDYGVNPDFTYHLEEGSALAPWDSMSSLNIRCSSTGVNFLNAPAQIKTSYSNENYVVTFIIGWHYITQREISLKVKNITKQYGLNREFKEEDLEYVSGSMAFDEPLSSLNLVFEARNDKNELVDNLALAEVGRYTLTVNAFNTNYNVTITDGMMTVVKRKVTITVNDIVKNYGDKDKLIPFTSSVEGVAFTGALMREEGEKPGVYNIQLGTLSVGDNYDLTLQPAALTIRVSYPPVAYAGIGTLGISLSGIIFLIIRKIKGAKII